MTNPISCEDFKILNFFTFMMWELEDLGLWGSEDWSLECGFLFLQFVLYNSFRIYIEVKKITVCFLLTSYKLSLGE